MNIGVFQVGRKMVVYLIIPYCRVGACPHRYVAPLHHVGNMGSRIDTVYNSLAAAYPNVFGGGKPPPYIYMRRSLWVP